jgi:UDP-galactopyranose mutase
MRYDFLIVGAGFAGCTLAERLATKLNKKVLLIEKQEHIGGHCYDCFDEHGILMHKYGPHIFHTERKDVWEYLCQFTEWRFYKHKVLGYVDDKLVPIPFNLNTLYALLPHTLAVKLGKKLVGQFGPNVKVPISTLNECEDPDLKFLADYVYKKIFLNYTLKQWGCKPEDLDPSVTGRVPVITSRDNRYFQDTYQGIPQKGYTKTFERMLANKNIQLMLNMDVKEAIKIEDKEIKLFGESFSGILIYTGPTDYLFGYKYGVLPYRSLRLDFEYYPQDIYQPAGTVNYPNDHEFTRITEFKHMTGQKASGTTILREYPIDCDPNIKGMETPFYVVNKAENIKLYEKYQKEASLLPNLILLGRLAEYRYYDMDAVISKALDVFNNRILKGI